MQLVRNSQPSVPTTLPPASTRRPVQQVILTLLGLFIWMNPFDDRRSNGEPPTIRSEEALERISEADIEEVVLQLGAKSFRTREAATAELMTIGPVALPVLRRLKDSDDPEMRIRIETITARLLNDDFETRVNAFLDGTKGASLPGWEYTRPRFGDRVAHREVFVEFTRRHPGIAMMLDGGKEERNQALGLLISDMGPSIRDPNFADTFGLLLLSSDAEVSAQSTSDGFLYVMMNRFEVTDALRNPDLRTSFISLLNQWILKTSQGFQDRALQIAISYDLSTAGELALSTLEVPNNEVYRVGLALQILAKVGKPIDAPKLKRLLDDRREIETSYAYQDAAGRRLVVQVRDAAMATIAILAGRDLKALGFLRPELSVRSAYQMESVGFPSGVEGEDARDRVKEEVEKLLLAIENGDPVSKTEQ